MSYSPGTTLAPQIKILDQSDSTLYTFETSQIAASPTQDFFPVNAQLHTGINDDHGWFSMLLIDNDLELLDSTTKGSKIPQQSNLTVSLGKDITGLARWFYGRVFKTQIIRDSTGVCFQFIFAIGWGIRGTERTSNVKFFQKKLSNGLDVDTTDTNAKASALVQKLWSESSHYALKTLPLETAVNNQGYGNVIDNLVQFADIQENFQTWTHIMSRLAGGSGNIYGIDKDRKLFFRQPKTVDSGFLITNDISSPTTTNWNQQKLAYINQSSFSWTDDSENTLYSVLHAFGVTNEVIDFNQASSNASYTGLPTNHIALPFTPNQAQLQKLAIKCRRIGTPASDAEVKLVGASAQASGQPKPSDLRKKLFIPKETLQALPTASDEYIEITFEKIDVVPFTKMFLILTKYGDASNTYYPAYQTGATADQYYTSTTGLDSSWTGQTGGATSGNPAMVFRSYPARSINFTLINTDAYRRIGIREKPIPFRDIPSITGARQFLLQIGNALAKQKRSYSKINIYTPYSFLPVGQYVRFIDKMTGLDTNLDVIGYDMTMDADNESNLGVKTISVTLEDFL